MNLSVSREPVPLDLQEPLCHKLRHCCDLEAVFALLGLKNNKLTNNFATDERTFETYRGLQCITK